MTEMNLKKWAIATDVLLLAIMIFYLMVCPFTKVEESFNTQATHDLLQTMRFSSSADRTDIYKSGSKMVNRDSLRGFDHFAFPGVVPRSFLGPVVLSTMTHYMDLVCKSIAGDGHVGNDDDDDEWLQMGDNAFDGRYGTVAGEWQLFLMRLVLGVISVMSQWFLRRGIARKFGHSVSIVYMLLLCSQFHLIFYMSRPLPNVFALVLVTLAIGYWMRDHYVHMFLLLGATATVFRSEVFALIVPTALICLFTRKISLINGVLTGASAIIYPLLFTFVVDSFFWQRALWPEGEVLYFNTFMNKSHEWGTQPFHWYFTSALPRSMLFGFILVPFGVLLHRTEKKKPSVLPFAISGFAFVALYSLLLHKELRFVFYAIPLFNITAAVGALSLLKKSGQWRMILSCLAIGGLMISLAVSQIFLLASHHNYFGAYALKRLYALEHAKQPAIHRNDIMYHVHMDAVATMNGVTRFVEMQSPQWTFYKSEMEQPSNYTHLLTENPEKHKEYFQILDEERGFARVNCRRTALVDTETKVYIMKRIERAERAEDREIRQEQGNLNHDLSGRPEFGVGYTHGHGTSTTWFIDSVLMRLFPGVESSDSMNKLHRAYLRTLSEYSLSPSVFARFTTLFLALVGLLFHLSAVMIDSLREPVDRSTTVQRASISKKRR